MIAQAFGRYVVFSPFCLTRLFIFQGPVNEKKQDFFIDCYFRQSWRDKRLAFNNTEVDFLPMNWQSLNTIWKPDTFFVNGKKSKMHKITGNFLSGHINVL